MPASENSSIAKKKGEQRIGPRQTREIADGLDRLTIPLHGDDHGECAKRHRDIDRDVNQNALRALFGARSEANQCESHVADRRVSHQALDIASDQWPRMSPAPSTR